MKGDYPTLLADSPKHWWAPVGTSSAPHALVGASLAPRRLLHRIAFLLQETSTRPPAGARVIGTPL
eukprot:4724015-Pyramimonas_sp.AAC.1